MDNLKAIKELVDTVDIFDTSNIDDIIDKINAVGCTSFMFKVVKDDDRVYIIPISGDKPIKIIVSKES